MEPPAFPWARFLARQIDLAVEGTVVAVLFGLAFPGWAIKLDEYGPLVLAMVLLPFIMVLDAAILGFAKTTLGKSLAGVRVTLREMPLSFSQALTRNGAVYVKGLALGIPLVNLVSMSLAARELRLGRRTSWDASGGYFVYGKPPSVGRWMFLVAVWIGLLVGMATLSTMNANERKREAASARGHAGRATRQVPTASPVPRQWKNAVTGRELMIPSGWREIPSNVDRLASFQSPSGTHVVLLGYEKFDFEVSLDNYLSALEEVNKSTWGGVLMEERPLINDATNRLGPYIGREYRGGNLGNLPVEVNVRVWSINKRLLWRSLEIRAAGPVNRDSREVIEFRGLLELTTLNR